MTIPTREEALAALQLIDNRTLFGTSAEGEKAFDILGAYIESRTVEVVAWITVETDGKVRTTHKKATADMWRAISGSKVSPLFASPVQPVKLEWDENGRTLLFGRATQMIQNGSVETKIGIGMTWRDCQGRYGWQLGYNGGVSPYAISGEAVTMADARSTLESAARKWLSGGDK